MRVPADRNQESRQGIVCPAPAKVNLALHVTGQRADGYHQLESLVVFCEAGDRLTVKNSRDLASGQVAMEIQGPFGGELKDGKLNGLDDNLVLRVAHLLMADPDFVAPEYGILFTLEKNLPVASGIGGGSADAAAALLGLVKLTVSKIGNDALMVLAAKLGADVPMCLYSAPLVARGIGERIELLPQFPTLHLLLVNPGIEVSTPKVFAGLRHRNGTGLGPLPPFAGMIDMAQYLEGQRNDLEAPALAIAPVIGEALRALRNSGARLARMSGSGATCFGLFETAETCQIAARKISANAPNWWVKATTSGAFGIDRAEFKS